MLAGRFQRIGSHPRFESRCYWPGSLLAICSECSLEGWSVSDEFSRAFNRSYCEHFVPDSDDVGSALAEAAHKAFAESFDRCRPIDMTDDWVMWVSAQYVAVYVCHDRVWCSWIGDMCFVIKPTSCRWSLSGKKTFR
jgi:hypothetical protein